MLNDSKLDENSYTNQFTPDNHYSHDGGDKKTPLSDLDTYLCQKLFQECRKGKVVNSEIIQNDQWTPNPIFLEVMGHLDEYKDLVLKTGYELITTKNSLYFVNSSASQSGQTLNFKAKVLLTIIIKYLSEIGKSPSYIKNLDSTSGLTVDDFNAMERMDGVEELLYRSGFTVEGKENPMYDAVKTILLFRGFLEEKTTSPSYVATSSGWSWCEQLYERGAEDLI